MLVSSSFLFPSLRELVEYLGRAGDSADLEGVRALVDRTGSEVPELRIPLRVQVGELHLGVPDEDCVPLTFCN